MSTITVSTQQTGSTYDPYWRRCICAGRAAKEMLGRTPDTVTTICPIKDGVIADFDKTVLMLKEYIRRCRSGIGSVTAVVSIPCRATPVEKRAVEEAVRAAGVKKVPLVLEKPIAAALGSGLSIFEPRGRMVVDIGGGTTEIAIISLGGIVSVTSTTCAGKSFDRDIVSYVRKTHSVLIGERTAESVKITIGSVFDDGHVNFMTVSGRDLVRGLPVNVALSTDDIRDALDESIHFLVDQIK
jgi:rod shape-determining protein MreB